MLSPERVRSVRKLLGMTQAEAARAVGVSRGLLAEAERGRRAGERTLTRLLEGPADRRRGSRRRPPATRHQRDGTTVAAGCAPAPVAVA